MVCRDLVSIILTLQRSVDRLQNNRSLRIGHGAHHAQSSFVPILCGGYHYYFDSQDNFQDYDQSQQPAQPQPQVIVIQQPVPAGAGQQGVDPGPDSAAQSSFAAPAAAPVPIRDVGEFILVRRRRADSVCVCFYRRWHAIAVCFSGRNSAHPPDGRAGCQCDAADERSTRNNGSIQQLVLTLRFRSSGRSEQSLGWFKLEEGEIPRFARNDAFCSLSCRL